MRIIKEVNTVKGPGSYLNKFRFSRLSKFEFTNLRDKFNVENPETALLWIESVWELYNFDHGVSKDNTRNSYNYFDWVHFNYIFYIEDIIKHKIEVQ